MFHFRRDPSRHSQYVCVCNRLLSTTDTLTQHVLGSTRPTNPRDPCSAISTKAIQIVQKKEIFDSEKKPINYHPADLMPGTDEYNEQRHMANIDKDPNNDEDDEADESDDIKHLFEENDHIQHLLKKNARALQKAMESNHKARSVIRKAQLKHRVKK